MVYDIIIIGSGPAGMSASIYAARYKLKVLVIGRQFGGQIVEAHAVENYPGIKSISGFELMIDMRSQAESLGVEIVDADVISISKDKIFDVKTADKDYSAKALILCVGTEKKKAMIKGEEEYKGKGVSYCYTCDAAFYKQKDVAVLGTGNKALHASLLLSDYAKEVHLINRLSKLRGDQILIDKVKEKNNIKIHHDAKIGEIGGSKYVEYIVFEDSTRLSIDGIFIEGGTVPNSDLIDMMEINKDEKGYIIVDDSQKTNIDGIYAAGDITTASNKFWQVVTAASEGAIAANSVFKYLKR